MKTAVDRFWSMALGNNSKLANAAKAAITELELDAKRYRWLRLDEERNSALSAEQLDAAIDKEMQQ